MCCEGDRNCPASAATDPPGPLPRVYQVNLPGNVSQAKTYTDLLKDPHDEALFEYYCQTELRMLKLPPRERPDAPAPGFAPPSGAAPAAAVGTSEPWGRTAGGGPAPPRLYTSIEPSPDGSYAMAEYLERPYSYTVPCGRFPRRVELWRRDGRFVREMAALPLAGGRVGMAGGGRCMGDMDLLGRRDDLK